ncbi:MAG: DUF308 domain-containing protein [Culicoidibacterales bacterium]
MIRSKGARAVLGTYVGIIGNLVAIGFGVFLILRPIISLEVVRYGLGAYLFIMALGIIVDTLIHHKAKNKHRLIKFIGYCFLLFVVLFSTIILKTSIEGLILFILLIDALLKVVSALQNKGERQPYWYVPIILGLISFIIIIIIIISSTGTLLVTRSVGVFVISESILDIFDMVFRGQNIEQTRKRWTINILYLRTSLMSKSGLPAQWMKNFKNQLAVDNNLEKYLQAEKVVKKLPTEAKNIIKIHIHSWNGDVVTMQGHCDAEFEGHCFSYGNYNVTSHKLGGFWSDGILVIAKTKPYIEYCLVAEKKILIEYTLQITDKQLLKLREFTKKMRQNTKPWKPQKSTTDPEQKNAALEMAEQFNAQFFTFNANRFKYYFALNTNCVRFVEQILDAIGIEDPKINGVITPGDYISFFEKKLADPNDYEVIGREVLVDKTKQNEEK